MKVKVIMRGLTIPSSKHKATKFRKRDLDLDDRLEELDNFLSQHTNNADEIKEKQQEYAKLKQEPFFYFMNKRKSAVIRLKRIEQGEQPTKYFLEK